MPRGAGPEVGVGPMRWVVVEVCEVVIWGGFEAAVLFLWVGVLVWVWAWVWVWLWVRPRVGV